MPKLGTYKQISHALDACDSPEVYEVILSCILKWQDDLNVWTPRSRLETVQAIALAFYFLRKVEVPETEELSLLRASLQGCASCVRRGSREVARSLRSLPAAARRAGLDERHDIAAMAAIGAIARAAGPGVIRMRDRASSRGARRAA